jgi:hypothetical protein
MAASKPTWLSPFWGVDAPLVVAATQGSWSSLPVVHKYCSLCGHSVSPSARAASNPQPAVRGEIAFFSPRYSFPARKNLILMRHNSKYRHPRKNKVRFVVRPKLPLWLIPLWIPPPPSKGDTIAQCHAGIGTNSFIPTFLTLVGTKWFGSKSQSG